MDSKLLIDAIMRQTTVFVAQLSAAAGIRAPLAHLMDEVFLQLSQELENQGLSRRVVADMFGMALRGYQRRVQRLRESETEAGQTLWQAIFEYIQSHERVTRRELIDRYGIDDPQAIGAVLADLTACRLCTKTGRGDSSTYRVTPEEDRQAMAREGRLETAAAIVWLELRRSPKTDASTLAGRLAFPEALVTQALVRLQEQGRLSRDAQGHWTPDALVIPVGAAAGWEAAVYDHFHAMCAAIGAKLSRGRLRSAAADTTGGATLSYVLSEDHPMRAEVMEQLSHVRAMADSLWRRVESYNAEHPIPEEAREQVTFYCGQYVHSLDLERQHEEEP